MPVYTAPGVYIQELPPSSSPIAGVSSSTAAFIGIVPLSPFSLDTSTPQKVIPGTGSTTVSATPAPNLLIPVGLKSTSPLTYAAVPITLPTDQQPRMYTSYTQFTREFGDLFSDLTAPGLVTLTDAMLNTGANPTTSTTTNSTTANSTTNSTTTPPAVTLSAELSAWRALAYAVYGFFSNGGTECYVILTTSATSTAVVDSLKVLTDVSIVAVTGLPLDDAASTSATATASQTTVVNWQNYLAAHCTTMQYRFAVLDGLPANPASTAGATVAAIQGATGNSIHAGLYYPRIKVVDPIEALINPTSNGLLTVAPSGHIAGVYARVDGTRGVYKAPANEVILGALDVEYRLDSNAQGALNPSGINVIRPINGNIRIWGARTLGGDANASFKYINVRRYFSYLCESIYAGTQFVVFEPNTTALWQQVIRSVSDFLLSEWQQGGLFGATPQQGYFVKCDTTTMTPNDIANGYLIASVGLALVKPAEFVVFQVQQATLS